MTVVHSSKTTPRTSQPAHDNGAIRAAVPPSQIPADTLRGFTDVKAEGLSVAGLGPGTEQAGGHCRHMTRILIADDHEVVRSGLRSILETQPKWEIVGEAADGKDALRKAIDLKPDVAILDYALPLINGVDATRQIRARVPTTEVLIFTMHDNEKIVYEAFQAGARGYLVKSDDKNALFAAVETVSRHKPFFSGNVSEGLLNSYLTGVPPSGPEPLSPRERHIIQLIAQGQANRRIADILDISVKTVETHRFTAMRKINVTSLAGLVRYAIRNKLIEA
jgi:DNA-binding NarL/FixJ family response regulator